MKRLVTLNQFMADRLGLFYGFFLVATPLCLIFYAKGRWFDGDFDAAFLLKMYLIVMALGAVLELVRRWFPSAQR